MNNYAKLFAHKTVGMTIKQLNDWFTNERKNIKRFGMSRWHISNYSTVYYRY